MNFALIKYKKLKAGLLQIADISMSFVTKQGAKKKSVLMVQTLAIRIVVSCVCFFPFVP